MVAQVAGCRADTCGNMQPFLLLWEPETEQNETTGSLEQPVLLWSTYQVSDILIFMHRSKRRCTSPPGMIRAFDVPDIPKGRAFAVGNLMWWSI